ncbi:MAG: Retaining alpha-galactosidase precursor [Paenibacillaceae bacterium]|jgi:alpha-glucosidase|nr:Retaining alpha-galactosidase precursor [Paenibacillaceae bacterium]
MNTESSKEYRVVSPQGNIQAGVIIPERGQLELSAGRRSSGCSDGLTQIAEPSPVGLTVGNMAYGTNVELLSARYSTSEFEFPVRGVHKLARTACNELRLAFRQQGADSPFFMEVRAYDDGIAYRYTVPGAGAQHVGQEASSWTLPADTTVWFFERNSQWKLKSYAGEWISAPVEEMASVSAQGPVQGMPLVLKYPGEGGGYGAIMEAALYNYSGMRLKAVGSNRFTADFWEGEAGFDADGPVVTPWRVLLSSPDLNGLVNSDLIASLNPPPDPQLFPDISYVRPGRSVFRWWCRGTGMPEEEREFVDYAARLGFEYTILDEGWEAWEHKWETVGQLAGYARARGVGVFLWKRSKEINDPADNWGKLRSFMDQAREAGAAGLKIDFIDCESKACIDFETAALQQAARRRLMINFHGISKPTGESRTYPNEITREGIRGLELNKMSEGPIPSFHNAALPFTRFLAGHGDYTPVGFSNPGQTTCAHQLATAILFTSPMQVIAEDPRILLEEESVAPALSLLMSLPTVWEETVVLPPSSIGEWALMARRSGTTWFVAGVNGGTAGTVEIPLTFLSAEQAYMQEIVSDEGDKRLVQSVERIGLRRRSLEQPLLAHGGIVIRYMTVD